MKVLSVVGTRPNFVQLAPLSKEIRNSGLQEVLIHTSQHFDYEMDRIFFQEFKIPEPDYQLNVGSSKHGVQTAKILMRLEGILEEEEPDIVLVFGDTNSTLAGALTAAKLHIPVGHIEAGTRSYDRTMSEEINRVAVDHICTLLFCSTPVNEDQLKREGIATGIYLTGDVTADALFSVDINNNNTHTRMGYKRGDYYIATIHRTENTDNRKRLENIITALTHLDNVIFPCHPRTWAYVEQYNLNTGNIKLIKPVGYADMIELQANARKIITDSGGIQKEAYMLGVPCITIRSSTEWPETLTYEWNVLVDADVDTIIKYAEHHTPVTAEPYPYSYFRPGACKRIVQVLKDVIG